MSIFGGDKAEARNLTAEIDRETDAAVLAESEVAETSSAGAGDSAENLASIARAEAAKTEMHELEQGSGWQAGEVSAETRALGGVALEQAVIASNEAIKEQVAVENGYVDTGLEAGKNVIGGESKKQIRERTDADFSDAQMESGVDLPPALQGEAELLSKNQESLAKEVVAALDQITRRGDAGPYQIERIIWEAKMKMLSTIGREWGERN